jgi:hypothetical protein
MHAEAEYSKPLEYLQIKKNWFENFEMWFSHLYSSIGEVRALFPVPESDVNNRDIWSYMPENLYERDAQGEYGQMGIGTDDPESLKRIENTIKIQELRNKTVKMCLAIEAMRRQLTKETP